MMNGVAAIGLVLTMVTLWGSNAYARGGGGSNFMNSPGYQRRLQESRGQVSVQSNGPTLAPPAVYPGRKWKKRGRR